MKSEKFLAAIGAIAFFISCSSIDCPVNNLVETQYELLASDGTELTLTDTLSVYTARNNGTDTLVLNMLTGSSSFSLPISYSHPEDILYFRLSNGSGSTVDTVSIKKEDMPRFESVDCNAAFFHRVTDVRYTTHGIDSIVINNPSVTYDNTTVHFHVYPKSGD